MELFSKRYKDKFRYRFYRTRLSIRDRDTNENLFISAELRNRLQNEVKYIIESNTYLEPFLSQFSYDQKRCYLHRESLRNLSLSAVGYDITEILDCKAINFDLESYKDVTFFDLIEFLIIFSKDDKRNELIERFAEHFKEEGDQFALHNFMIMSKREGGLSSIVPLVKDLVLKKKLEEYYENRGSYQTDARVSADIIQFIFSSPISKTNTKDYSQDLCEEIAKELTNKPSELSSLLNTAVKNTKDLNNQISNIRHTDAHTIPVDSPDFYKMISIRNIQLAELAILALPERFILQQDPSEIKNNYFEKYKIDNTHAWVEPKEPDIRIEDIPF